jgi:DnaJ like chaperone protein
MSFWRKIARLVEVADGASQSAEYEAFSHVFQAEAGSEGNVRRLYQLAHQTTRGFEGYARRLRKRYGACPQLLEDVLDGLFHIAASDGAVTADELGYLEEVCRLFGLSPLTFRRLKATHLGAANDDPYVILGVPPDASDEAVRAAWKAQLSEAHPDRARARGLPSEFIEVAEAKSAAINAAYDQILRERKALFRGVA